MKPTSYPMEPAPSLKGAPYLEINDYISRCMEAARLLLHLLEALPVGRLTFSQRQRLRRILERIARQLTRHLQVLQQNN